MVDDRDRWWSLVNTVISFQYIKSLENIFLPAVSRQTLRNYSTFL